MKVISFLCLFLCSTVAFAGEVIRVTGIPDENPTELQRKNKPLVTYLESELGTKVKYIPVTDYGAAVQALASGKVDFAWLGGFTHVQSRRMAGGEPLCMRGIDREFKSVFIANKKSLISKLADLKGKSFAFGSMSSTSGHLMPRYYLTSTAKINADKDFKGLPVFSGAHDATAKLVETGKVQAGALNFEVWKRMVKNKQVDTTKVNVFWTTPGYVDYVWTARKGVSPALKAKFMEAFLKLEASNPKHNEVLTLQGAKKFVKASASDFDAIEQVGFSTGLIK